MGSLLDWICREENIMPLGAHKADIMGVSGVSTADVVLLSSQTADADDTISFTSGIDSTYGEYIFKFYDISPATDTADFTFQVNASSQSGYNETLTSTSWIAHGYESGSGSSVNYQTAQDQAQGTAFQVLGDEIGSGADESLAGELHIFNPSGTTYVKHFLSRSTFYGADDSAKDTFQSGYFNFTAALTNVQFKMDSGAFDGKIKMWGVK